MSLTTQSPLPPFCKGGNTTPGIGKQGHWSRERPCSSSPFEKGGSRGIRLFLLLLLLLASPFAPAQPATDSAPLQFQDTAEERRFHALVSELRCVMCQNQSLADSNAQIAVDLRREVLALMRQGKSDSEIKDFLVARYGEFVLYRPQVESKTWLLWFGPALVLIAGGAVVVGVVRRRGGARKNADAPESDQDQEW